MSCVSWEEVSEADSMTKDGKKRKGVVSINRRFAPGAVFANRSVSLKP